MDDDTVPYGLYECDQCGACCKGTVIVEADYLDVRREPRLIQLQVGPYRTTQRELEDDGKIVLLACGTDKPCPCLDADESLHDLHHSAQHLRRLRSRQRKVPGSARSTPHRAAAPRILSTHI
jgi:hypothetical protein